MAHTAKTAREIVDDAIFGRFDIPEFQRGFVWSPEKVKSLLDSLCRDYPLGSILLWQSPEYTSARGASTTESQRAWIVDGQQRATALCLIVGKKPYWFPTPDPWNELFRKCGILVNLRSEPDELELSLPNPIILAQKHWYPVRDLLALQEDQIPARAIQLVIELGGNSTDAVQLAQIMAVIQRLHSALGRSIVLISIDHDPVDVAEIFSRLNSKGTRVNEGDIALALIAVRQVGWVREELLPYLKDLTERGFNFDPSFVIRSMVAIRRGGARLRDVPREFWEHGEQFDEGWDKTKKAINNVIRVLGELGILTAELLPARNALIPLFAFDDLFCQGNAETIRKAYTWLLRAIRDGRYSSSAITTITQDLTAIRKETSPDAALAALNATLHPDLCFTSADMLRRYDEEPFLRLMLYLAVFDNKAEDWKTGQRLGFDRTANSLNDGFRPEWHHFVPRGKLERRQPSPPPEESINALANIVVLGEGDNRRFSYSEPHQYLEKYSVPDGRVHQQFFPDRALWTTETFEKFVEARSAVLAEALNKYVAKLDGQTDR